jgi:hypothetical protein
MYALAWLHVWWAWLMMAAVLISAGYHYMRLTSPLVTAIAVNDAGYQLFVRGVWREVNLESAFITEPMTVISFKDEQGISYFLTLLRDSLSVDDYRRLRVHLRWCGDKP